MPESLLTVLIPSYNGKVLLDAAIDDSRHFAEKGLIYIISEDGDSLYDPARDEPMITVVRGPGCGAVANWNHLLKFRQSKFYALVHQDERLVIDESHTLFSFLEKTKFDTLILAPKCQYGANLFPMSLRALIVRFFPKYILHRNIIGPTACMITRVTSPDFDQALEWRVDSDWFYRIISQSNSIGFTDTAYVSTGLRLSSAITATLKSSPKKFRILNKKENLYLYQKHSISPRDKCLFKVIDCAWLLMKGINYAYRLCFVQRRK